MFELIVALAISAVIAGFVFSFSRSLAEFWRDAQVDTGTDLDANVVLDQIAADLEGAVLQERDGAVMFAVTAQESVDVTDPVLPDTFLWEDSDRPDTDEYDFNPAFHRYGWAGAWLRFFTAAPTFNAVSYQIVRRVGHSGLSFPRYSLYRSVVRHDHTVNTGFDLELNSAYFNGSASLGSPGEIRKPNLQSLILENVVDFGVRLYVYDTAEIDYGNEEAVEGTFPPSAPLGMRLIFPSHQGAIFDNSPREYMAHIWSPELSDDTRYPDLVEVFLRVLDADGAERLRAMEQLETEDSYEEIISEHSRIYRRMARILASSR